MVAPSPSRAIRRGSWAAALLIPLLLGNVGCSEEQELSAGQKSIRTFNASVTRYAEAMAQAAELVGEIETAAEDETMAYDPISGLPSETELLRNVQLLDDLAMAYRRAFLAGYEMTMVAKDMELARQEHLVHRAGLSLEQRWFALEPVTITYGLVASGVALTTWWLTKKTEKSKDDACGPVRNRILPIQNQKCLDMWAYALEMKTTTDVMKETILQHIKSHPGRAEYCTKAGILMQSLILEPEMAGVNCQVPDAAEVIQTQYDTMKDNVANGANAIKSFTTTVSGIDPMSVVSAPLSDVGRIIVDVTLKTEEVLMEKAGAVSEVTLIGQSSGTTTVTVPPVEDAPPPADNPQSVLKDPNATGEAVDGALDRMMTEVAQVAQIPVTTEGDGTLRVDVPNRIFTGQYAIPGLTQDIPLPIPNIGFSTMMVLVPGMVPEVTEELDTSEDLEVALGGVPLSECCDKLNIHVPAGVVSTGDSLALRVHCPPGVSIAGPTSLTTNSIAGMSLSWGNFNACPFVVLFDADRPGTYDIRMSLTDAEGAVWEGYAKVTVVGETDTPPIDDPVTPPTPGAETWTDSATGLTWQMEPDMGGLAGHTEGMMRWSEAKPYCESLRLSGGGWRLPTIGELRSLLRGCPNTVTGGSCRIADDCLINTGCAQDETCTDCWDTEECRSCAKNEGPAATGDYGVGMMRCYWHTALGGRCNGTQFWSSSEVDNRYSGSDTDVWGVDFHYGSITTISKSYERHVRCVR